MIKERYCSYEVARLLKEKGFDEECHHIYVGVALEWTNTIYGEDVMSDNEIPDADIDVITAPTHQMAIDWLREEKNIFIIIEPHAYDYVNDKNDSYAYSLWVGDNYYEYIESKDYPSYEDTVEVALKYCLEKIIK